MSTKEFCRTCLHCCSVSGQGPTDGWCRLRKIIVSGEISQIAFCHHWTKKSPSLPNLQEKTNDFPIDQQLEIGRTLAVSDK